MLKRALPSCILFLFGAAAMKSKEFGVVLPWKTRNTTESDQILWFHLVPTCSDVFATWSCHFAPPFTWLLSACESSKAHWIPSHAAAHAAVGATDCKRRVFVAWPANEPKVWFSWPHHGPWEKRKTTEIVQPLAEGRQNMLFTLLRIFLYMFLSLKLCFCWNVLYFHLDSNWEFHVASWLASCPLALFSSQSKCLGKVMWYFAPKKNNLDVLVSTNRKQTQDSKTRH